MHVRRVLASIEMRHHEVVNAGLANAGAVNPDQHVHDGLPVTVHMGGHGTESAERGLAFLRENGLFGPGTTYVHPNHYTDDALKQIADSGGTASVSPLIEVELGIGYPATGRARATRSASCASCACATGSTATAR